MRDEGRGKIKRGIIVHRPSSIVSRPMKGQSFLEYTMVIGVIVLILFAMGPIMKRGIQSLIKAVADEVGTQQNAEQRFDERGHLEASYVSTRASIDKQMQDLSGMTVYTYNDVTATESAASINLGFTEED